MPLNPPTYQSMDVFYSNNVFVNKVPVALWKPPAGAFNDGSPGTAITSGGDTMYGNNESGSKAMYRDESSSMGEGALGDDDGGDATENFKSSIGSTGPIDTFSGAAPTGPNPNPSAPAVISLPAKNLPNFYPKDINDPVYSQQISKYFRLGHIRRPPEDEPTFNLTARDVAGNFAELCLNILDPIYTNFKFRSNPLESAYRPTSYNNTLRNASKTSDHIKGCAADISMGNNEQNIAMFKWIIRNRLPFRQVLIEKLPSSGRFWIHVSYLKGQKKEGTTATGYSPTGSASGIVHGGQNGETLPDWLKP